MFKQIAGGNHRADDRDTIEAAAVDQLQAGLLLTLRIPARMMAAGVRAPMAEDQVGSVHVRLAAEVEAGRIRRGGTATTVPRKATPRHATPRRTACSPRRRPSARGHWHDPGKMPAWCRAFQRQNGRESKTWPGPGVGSMDWRQASSRGAVQTSSWIIPTPWCDPRSVPSGGCAWKVFSAF